MKLAITGASGTLGKALTRRCLIMPQIEKLVLSSRDQHKIAAMWETYGRPAVLRIRKIEGLNAERLTDVFQECDVVVHAAASKRLENDVGNSWDMTAANIDGLRETLTAADRAEVGRFLFISSDKGCLPENAYGKTKSLAEELTIDRNEVSYPRGMKCSVVRYGNVMGSAGSVVHIWRSQLAAGQPLTLTDPTMSRFILTVEQAVEFIFLALDRMMGGEIFVPRLPSMRLLDLAHVMGGEDVQLKDMGLRPGGEKIAERLLGGYDEIRRTLDQHGTYVVTPGRRSWSAIPYRGEPIDPKTVYTSDSNDRWLTPEEIRSLLEGVV